MILRTDHLRLAGTHFGYKVDKGSKIIPTSKKYNQPYKIKFITRV